jgi:hypothetical protein
VQFAANGSRLRRRIIPTHVSPQEYNMNIRKRVAALSVLTVIAALCSAPAIANAASWGPLKVSDGGTIRGIATGTATATTVHLKNVSTYAGTVYEGSRVETSWYFYDYNQVDKLNEWTYYDRSNTPTNNSLSAVTATNTYPLDPADSKGRAEPRICIPKPWGTPVPCSSFAIITLSY